MAEIDFGVKSFNPKNLPKDAFRIGRDRRYHQIYESLEATGAALVTFDHQDEVKTGRERISSSLAANGFKDRYKSYSKGLEVYFWLPERLSPGEPKNNSQE